MPYLSLTPFFQERKNTEKNAWEIPTLSPSYNALHTKIQTISSPNKTISADIALN
jgi:hypothetical protein